MSTYHTVSAKNESPLHMHKDTTHILMGALIPFVNPLGRVVFGVDLPALFVGGLLVLRRVSRGVTFGLGVSGGFVGTGFGGLLLHL